MKSRRPAWRLGLLAAILAVAPGRAGYEPGSAPERRALQSRIESLAHGYVTAVEWDRLRGELHSLRAAARAADDPQTVLEIDLLTARALGDLRREWDAALDILRAARAEGLRVSLRGMHRVYLAEAAVLSRLGDAEGIASLIETFRASPHFDPQEYPWSGGDGPRSPLVVTRPWARGSDSLTVTAMERYRREARFASGAAAPDFAWVDTEGRLWTREALRGRVAVLNFWIAGAPVSDRLSPHLERLRARHGEGIVVIGVCLNLDTGALRERQRRDPGLPPPQVGRDEARDTLRTLAIFGDAQIILLDRGGRIAARVRDGVTLEREAGRLFATW